MNPTGINEDEGLIPGPAQWVKDLALLWLWCRPAPLAWELTYVTPAALKEKKRKREKQKGGWKGLKGKEK